MKEYNSGDKFFAKGEEWIVVQVGKDGVLAKNEKHHEKYFSYKEMELAKRIKGNPGKRFKYVLESIEKYLAQPGHARDCGANEGYEFYIKFHPDIFNEEIEEYWERNDELYQDVVSNQLNLFANELLEEYYWIKRWCQTGRMGGWLVLVPKYPLIYDDNYGAYLLEERFYEADDKKEIIQRFNDLVEIEAKVDELIKGVSSSEFWEDEYRNRMEQNPLEIEGMIPSEELDWGDIDRKIDVLTNVIKYFTTEGAKYKEPYYGMIEGTEPLKVVTEGVEDIDEWLLGYFNVRTKEMLDFIDKSYYNTIKEFKNIATRKLYKIMNIKELIQKIKRLKDGAIMEGMRMEKENAYDFLSRKLEHLEDEKLRELRDLVENNRRLFRSLVIFILWKGRDIKYTGFYDKKSTDYYITSKRTDLIKDPIFIKAMIREFYKDRRKGLWQE